MAEREVQSSPVPEAESLRPNGREVFLFGPYVEERDCVFYLTPLSFAFVNLKPIAPGHVLVSPRFDDAMVQRRLGSLLREPESESLSLSQWWGFQTAFSSV